MSAGIGSKLRKLRTEKGLTQKELAAKVTGGLDYTYIGKIEREEQSPSLKILAKLADALEMPLSTFFLEDDKLPGTAFNSGKLVKIADAREMAMLVKELNLLHKDDISLLIEIARVLRIHRKSGADCRYHSQEAGYALVAENEPGYEGKD